MANAPDWIQSVSFVNSNVGYAVGGEGTNGFAIKTTNAGATWVSQSIPTNYAMYSVYFTDALSGYAVGNSGEILKNY